jgi:hypothetical protein
MHGFRQIIGVVESIGEVFPEATCSLPRSLVQERFLSAAPTTPKRDRGGCRRSTARKTREARYGTSHDVVRKLSDDERSKAQSR